LAIRDWLFMRQSIGVELRRPFKTSGKINCVINPAT